MNLNFSDSDSLIPAIVQDVDSLQVLMLGYMNDKALQQTLKSGKVTFFSRSKQRLWVKGETSGNFLRFVDLFADCDRDALLILARPTGPVCHTGTQSCFGERTPERFLSRLEGIINERLRTNMPGSYTSRLSASGIGKVAQKVGEEAVEVVIEAMTRNKGELQAESADLLYHLLLLLSLSGSSLKEVEAVLRERNESAE